MENGRPPDLRNVFKPKRNLDRTPPTDKEHIHKKRRSQSCTGSIPTDKTEDKTEESNKSKEKENKDNTKCQMKDKPNGISNNSDEDSKLESNEFEEQELTKEATKPDILIEKVLRAIDKIHEATEREFFGEAVFNVADKVDIRKSCYIIHKQLTRMAYQIGQLQKENSELKSKSSKCTVNGNHTKPSTYASIVQKNTSTEMERSLRGAVEALQPPTTPRVWTTPPKTNDRLETLIRINNIEDAHSAIKEIKKSCAGKDTEGGFKNIIPLKSGSVIIESHNTSQQNKLLQLLGTQQDVSMKNLGNLDPMFMLTGIEKGFKEEEFIDQLIRQNTEIRDMTQGDASSIKVIARKMCRNPNKENWILQARPAISKWFLKKQKVTFDLEMVYVVEYIPVTMCFKCCGFGHVAKYCKNKQCCHKCGAEHLATDCTSKELCCTNCNRMGYPEINHSARDFSSCATYLKKMERVRLNINYSENKNFR